MSQQQEIKNNLQTTLSEVKEEILKLSNDLEQLKKLQQTENTNSDFELFNKAKSELTNNLSEKGKRVLATRETLKKKISRYNLLGCLAFLGLIILGVCTFAVFKISISLLSIGLYLAVAIIEIIISVIVVRKVNAPYELELKNTFSDPNMQDFDRELKNLQDELSKNISEKHRIREERNKKIETINTQLNKLKETESAVFLEISELDFNFAYKDSILFYGQEKGNYYKLYLDGLLFDTVRGKQITKIMLSPGLHSFKVKNTNYDFTGDVVYCYEFNTYQFTAGEQPMAYPIVCEFNHIKCVSGTEFQKITKTNLI